MKTYTDRRPPFFWAKTHNPRVTYIVLSDKEAVEYGNRLSDFRRKVRERAESVFARDATPQTVKVCDEKGKELNVIERRPAKAPEPKPEARPAKKSRSSPSSTAGRADRIKFLSTDEIEALLNVISDRRDKAIFLLAYRYGLRASEVGLLTRDDVKLGQRKIFIHRLKGSISKEYSLQPDEVKTLRFYFNDRENSSPALFPSSWNEPISRPMLYKLIRQYGEEAGIPKGKRKFTVLKHSIATHLLEAGADLKFVQEWLGHAQIQSTMIYAELVSPARDRKARELFANLPRF